MRQRKLIPMHHRRQDLGLLQIRDVAPDAGPRARREGHEERLQGLALLAEPPLGDVLVGLGERALVVVRHELVGEIVAAYDQFDTTNRHRVERARRKEDRRAARPAHGTAEAGPGQGSAR